MRDIWDLSYREFDYIYNVEGLTLKEIGERFGVHRATAGNVKRELGVEPYFYNKELLHHLYVTRRKTTTEIADQLHCSTAAVVDHMDRHDIETNGNRYVKPPSEHMLNGYVLYTSRHGDKQHQFYLHQLLAIAEYGFEAVCDMDVHHKNGVRWDNRPENIELMSRSDHMSYHNSD